MFLRSLFTVILVLTGTGSSFAQDSNYWTEQFGNRARLLGGAVIGGANDLSAVYYNPGALALVGEPQLLLSGNVFEYSTLEVADALGEGRPLDSSRFTLSPSLFAGEIKTGNPKNRFAYAFLTRYQSEARINDAGTITAILPNAAFSSVSTVVNARLSEYWIGGTFARQLSDTVGIGVSPFLAVRNNRLQTQALMQAVSTGDEQAIGVAGRDFDYQYWRMVFKGSIAAEWQQWNLGVTATLPSIGLFGSGDRSVDRSFVVQNGPGEVTTDSQNGLSAFYKSPLSIAFGAGRRFGKARVQLAAEWFDSLPVTTILDAEPFASQATVEVFDVDVGYALESVTNFAVGVDYQFSPDLGTYFRFHTNFTPTPSGNLSNDTVARWDIYHVSGGATISVVGSELTLGGIYAFGTAPVGSNEVGLERTLEATYTRVTFIVGFNFLLGR